ncbi:MAG: sigma 54-interacting transcriptional regulator, partial [Trichlorobacter sp.]|uniref:helix-turn-helix domain-containing protein n=1 Tax=Trichlorobacter sp. TaxID=2911007 RepID=UPI00256C4C9C
VRVDVRVVAATSYSLTQAVSDGQFREDLYQQLQVVPLELTPLRERRDDIPLLVKHFVCLFHRREGWEPKVFDDSALACLQSYDWPGNIRELKNIIERILIMSVGPVVTATDLPELMPGGSCRKVADMQGPSDDNEGAVSSLHSARERFERDFIQQALQHSFWDLDKAATLLEIERTALQRKLLQYGLKPQE